MHCNRYLTKTYFVSICVDFFLTKWIETNSDKRKGVHSEKRFKMSMQVTSQCVQGKLKAQLDERDVVKAGHIHADSFLIRQHGKIDQIIPNASQDI